MLTTYSYVGGVLPDRLCRRRHVVTLAVPSILNPSIAGDPEHSVFRSALASI
jgi:hypothetical protein